MGSLAFDEMKTLLQFRAGNRADLLTGGPNSDLNLFGIWINSAYRQLCTRNNLLSTKRKLYFPQLHTSTTKTTTDGTAYVTEPTSCLYITEVYDTTHNLKLKNISWKDYITYTDRTDTSSESDPTEWVHQYGRVYLHKTPQTTGDTITIYYKKLVDDLTGTDTTVIGAEWDDVIIELAAYIMHTHMGETDRATTAKELCLEMIEGLVDIMNEEKKDGELQFGPSQSYLSR